MMDTVQTFPVIIRALPLTSYSRKEAIHELVAGCLRATDTADGRCKTVDAIFSPLPANLIQTANPPPWRQWEETPSLPDLSLADGGELCDGVVVFKKREEAQSFGMVCESEKKLFCVDILYQEIFCRIEASILPRYAKILKNALVPFKLIHEKSGVTIKSDNQSAVLIGQEWQIDIAKYYLQRVIEVVQQSPESTTEQQNLASENSQIVNNESFVTNISQERKEIQPQSNNNENTSKDDSIDDGKADQESKILNEKTENARISTPISIKDSSATPDEKSGVETDEDRKSQILTESFVTDTKKQDSNKSDEAIIESNAENLKHDKQVKSLPLSNIQTENLKSQEKQPEKQKQQIVYASNYIREVKQALKVNFRFWIYMKSKEKQFCEQLQTIVKELGLTIQEDRNNRQLVISGTARPMVESGRKRIHELYEGFEFILMEKILDRSNQPDIRLLETTHPRLLFIPEQDETIYAVGEQSDVLQFLKSISNAKSNTKQKEVIKDRLPPNKTMESKENPPVASGSALQTQCDMEITMLTSVHMYVTTYFTQQLDTIRDKCRIDAKRTHSGEMVVVRVSADSPRNVNDSITILKNLCAEVWTEQLHFDDEKMMNNFIKVIQQSIQCVSIPVVETTCVQLACLKSHTRTVFDVFEHSKSISRKVEVPKIDSEKETAEFVPTGFLLNGNVQFLIHVCDLTQLYVDSLVIPTASLLQHGGGVAKLVSEKAGPEFQYECSQLRGKSKSYSDSEVVLTTGGHLPVKSVIHAVVPIWTKYPTDKQLECIRILKSTFFNIFDKAKQEKFTSIALPPISAGSGKVPHEHVAWTLCEALMTATCCENLKLEIIHLVNISEEILTLVCQELRKRQANEEMTGHIIELDQSRVEKSLSRFLCSPPRGFNIHDRVCVYIHQGDIAKCKVDAITCTVDSSFNITSGFSKEFAKLMNPILQSEIGSRVNQEGTVIPTRTIQNLWCVAVFNAILPKDPGNSKAKQDHFASMLVAAFQNILIEARNMRMESVAIPLLLRESSKFPVQTMSRVLCDALTDPHGVGNLKEIHIVDQDTRFLTSVIQELGHCKHSKPIPQEVVQVVVGDTVM